MAMHPLMSGALHLSGGQRAQHEHRAQPLAGNSGCGDARQAALQPRDHQEAADCIDHAL